MLQEEFFNKIANFSCIYKEYSFAGIEYKYTHSMKMFVLSIFANDTIYFYDYFSKNCLTK